jgi:hypothetical protein
MRESEGTANVPAFVSEFSSRRINIRWANALYSAMQGVSLVLRQGDAGAGQVAEDMYAARM